MADKTNTSRFFTVSAAALILAVVLFLIFKSTREKYTVVAVTGIHHLGTGYSISSFYLNDGFQGNISREGGGGVMCCASIPIKWRPGISVDVRWAVADWRAEIEKEISKGNYHSIRLVEVCRASVTIEKYLAPGRLYIHFFPHGRVRVVSSDVGPENYSHPVREGILSEEQITGTCETKKGD